MVTPVGVDPRRVQRALSERIFLMAVQEHGVFSIMGSTGVTAYEVTINPDLDCSCPDSRVRGNLCKHQIFVWVRVLRLDVDDIMLEMDDELRAEIREKMLNIPQLCYGPSTSQSVGAKPTATRKPIEGNDCPICFEELKEGEALFWCSASCGNSIHTDCWNQWAKYQKTDLCVLCRQKFVAAT